MIQLENIDVALGGRSIIKHLDLHVKAHEKTVISGESGSGKSTLLQTLLGRYRPDQGSISIGGMPLRPENLTAIRETLFYLPQDVTALGDESVEDFLKAPLALAVNRTRKFDASRVASFFDLLGLRRDISTTNLANLSGGERKRMGLIQGLLLDRPLLILDELTSSVDEENREKLVELVLSLPRTTVLAIAHDSYFMERAERHLILKNGRLEEV